MLQVTIVVVAVPEGLPLAVTLTYVFPILAISDLLVYFSLLIIFAFLVFVFSLAYSMRKMMADKALV